MSRARAGRSARPGAGGREAAAFTLLELVVVVAVIALLVAILVPAVTQATALARSAACRYNLHQIANGFHAADSARQGGDKAPRFPAADVWPAVPMNVLPTPGIYRCPEEPRCVVGSDEYQLYVKSVDAYINFDENHYCRVFDLGGRTRYCFEVYTGPDWNDAIFDVTPGPPRIATFSHDSHITPGVALRHRGQDVPGWEELSPAQFGRQVVFAGGLTNYGINARAGEAPVPPTTLVLLDYDLLTANGGEDMAAHLRASARHPGGLNVLGADESVGTFGPGELDPAMSAAAAERWSP